MTSCSSGPAIFRPAEPPASAQPLAPPSPSPRGALLEGPFNGLPLRVLVADDMPINRQLLVMQLKKLFKEIEVFDKETGEDALEALRSTIDFTPDKGFDIAFLVEVYGPHPMKGTEVTQHARAAGVTARSGGPLPIIGCTGNQGAGAHNEQAFAAGQNSVWGKPFPPAEQMREELVEFLGL